MKRCSYCAVWHPETEFYKSSQTKDFLQSYCKTCCKAYAKRRRTIKVQSPTNNEAFEQVLSECRKAALAARSLSDVFRICKRAKFNPYLDKINLSDVLTEQNLRAMMALVPLGYKFED